MADKLPYIQFYPGDWLRDSVCGCSLAAQGLWLRMLIIAHDSDRYGYLAMNGSPMPPETIARRCGCDLVQYETLLAELVMHGVPGVNDDGVLYSRRMVRDASVRKVRAKAGRKGGKQSIIGTGFVYAARRSGDGAIKLGASTRPQKRPTELRRALPGQQVELLGFWPVTSMVLAESALRAHFAARALGNEWYEIASFDAGDVHKCLSSKGLVIDAKARAKPAQNPEDEVEDEVETKKKKKVVDLPPLPPLLDNGQFRTAFDAWLRYKTERRESYKPSGLTAVISVANKRAEQHGVEAVITAMESAMSNGWQGWDQKSSFVLERPQKRPGDPRGNIAAVQDFLARRAVAHG